MTFTIDGIEIKKGERRRINIDMGRIYDFTKVTMPVEIIRGKKDGPTLFISSTIHGDEINGIEILRQLLRLKALKNICGTLIIIPIVNIFGFNDRSRYLPDRRDLNRCFPGLRKGSLASQLANKFMQEIVLKSDFGIDLHTGSAHRSNFPQVRANINDKRTFELARIFAAPVIVNSNLRDGSLRSAVSHLKIPMILFEGGEALRFDKESIEVGLTGILNVLKATGMIKARSRKTLKKTFISRSSSWIRAPESGIVIPGVKLGKIIKKGDVLAHISNPLGDHCAQVKSDESGMIIGISVLPLANKGDALFHIASEKEGGTELPPMPFDENFENIHSKYPPVI